MSTKSIIITSAVLVVLIIVAFWYFTKDNDLLRAENNADGSNQNANVNEDLLAIKDDKLSGVTHQVTKPDDPIEKGTFGVWIYEVKKFPTGQWLPISLAQYEAIKKEQKMGEKTTWQLNKRLA